MIINRSLQNYTHCYARCISHDTGWSIQFRVKKQVVCASARLMSEKALVVGCVQIIVLSELFESKLLSG